MIRKFLPKEDKFFHFFDEISVHLVNSAQELVAGLKTPALIAEKAIQIREIESAADSVTHKTLERLHNSFITPFDRQDIHALIEGLDNIIDLIHAVSERLVIYHIKQVPQVTLDLAQSCYEAALQIQKAIACLPQIRNPDPLRLICAEIHRIENENDVLFRKSIEGLFRDENDMKTLISLKDINEFLEDIADKCEVLASHLETIILEYT